MIALAAPLFMFSLTSVSRRSPASRAGLHLHRRGSRPSSMFRHTVVSPPSWRSCSYLRIVKVISRQPQGSTAVFRRGPSRDLRHGHHRGGVFPGAAAAQPRRHRRSRWLFHEFHARPCRTSRLVALDSVGSTPTRPHAWPTPVRRRVVVGARARPRHSRRGRASASPVGSLYTSTILAPQLPHPRHELGFVSALSPSRRHRTATGQLA